MIMMKSFYILILILNAILLFLLLQIDASHFQGGTITYKILNTSGSIVSIVLTQTYIYDYASIRCNSSMIANQSPRLYFNPAVYSENFRTVQCIQFCNQSVGYIAPSVVSPCIDFSIGMSMTVGQRSDIINLTNGSFFRVAYQSSSWRSLSLPTGMGGSGTNWSISTLIDLRLRANGQYNQPPVATIISPIYIPVGIQQIISIPTIDADNDDVRCRFAQGGNECGAVCPPSSLPNGTAIFSNCTLQITGAKAGDWYAVTLAIEDFVDTTSSTPFSVVPVQFLINIQNVSSCCQRPVLNSSTATQDACVGLQVNQTYEIQLIAQVLCPNATIIDISTISFPIVVKSSLVRNSTTTWSTTLRWTPTASSIGSQILCAIAVDSNKIQSNQYCMSFTVAAGNVPWCPGQEIETTVETTATTTSSESLSSSNALSTDTQTTTINVDTSTASTSTNNHLETSVLSSFVSTAISTESTIVSTTTSTSTEQSGSSFPWLWIFILVGTTVFALSLLGLTFCCWFCCPKLFSLKPKENRRNSMENISLPNDVNRLSSTSPSPRDSDTLGQHRDRSYSMNSNSSSSAFASPRSTNNIELEIYSNQPRWRIIHYRRLLPPSPRITPMSISSPSSSLMSR